jgi:imidazoleglycerol phosphate dehydratase HisB
MARTARIERTTKESSVLVELNLDGTGQIDIETGVPFSRNLANEKTEAKKVETAKAESTAKAGKVEVTTVAEMHKTLSKALAQARILNQTIFAGELVDFIIATYPDFKETVLSK